MIWDMYKAAAKREAGIEEWEKDPSCGYIILYRRQEFRSQNPEQRLQLSFSF